MWSAIKSDLFEFVNTVTVDTSKVVTKVLGDETGDKEEVSAIEKRMIDIRRSFLTYSTPIEDYNRKHFDSWRRNFSLTSKAAEIAQVLDQEPDTSRFYADLVPNIITADEFWARYFFRIAMIQKGNAVTLDEEDEEDIGWEDDEEEVAPEEVYDQTATANPDLNDTVTAHAVANPNEYVTPSALVSENETLTEKLKAMSLQVTYLESQLSEKTSALQCALKQVADLQSALASIKTTPDAPPISASVPTPQASHQEPSPVPVSVPLSVPILVLDNGSAAQDTTITVPAPGTVTVTPETKKKKTTKAVAGDKPKTPKAKAATSKPTTAAVGEVASGGSDSGQPSGESAQSKVVTASVTEAPQAAAAAAASDDERASLSTGVAAGATAPVNLSLEEDEEDSWA